MRRFWLAGAGLMTGLLQLHAAFASVQQATNSAARVAPAGIVVAGGDGGGGDGGGSDGGAGSDGSDGSASAGIGGIGGGTPTALNDAIKRGASDQELIEIANAAGFDLQLG
jgi:hypothetical protein